MSIDVTFVGCGDAFGSGGRFNTCFHVKSGTTEFLIDCGASSLIALKQQRIDPNAIRTILITHFHADHFGGLPFFLLDARFFSKRINPLTIAGPRGIETALMQYMETSFIGSSETKFGFPLEIMELKPNDIQTINGLIVQPQQVNHGKEGGPYFAYRVELDGKAVAYTGDTEWTDTLVPVGRGADLFIAEAYFRDRPVKLHLDLATLEKHLPAINPKRLILTHLSDEMLGRMAEVTHETAYDGLTVRI